jgi:hypothetical protein
MFSTATRATLLIAAAAVLATLALVASDTAASGLEDKYCLQHFLVAAQGGHPAAH